MNVDVVPRAIRRDTMLALAGDAQPNMKVVQERDQDALVTGDGTALFRRAVGLLLEEAATAPPPASAAPDRHWGFRRMGYEHAAAVISFGRFMGMSLEPDRDVADLYRSALNELYETSVDDRALDPLAEVNLTYRLIRGLRADSRPDEAYTLAIERDEDFYSASGAETRWADVQFEIGACRLESGDPEAVFAELGRFAGGYWAGTQARHYSTRHRYAFILGLAGYARGHSRAAIRRMTAGLAHLRTHRVPDTRHDLYQLSLTLALAEVRAAAGDDVEQTAALVEDALDIAERVRTRWGVIARTPTPMAMAFRRVYGDVALLAARLGSGPRAAALGLRVCLSAKQSGFATQLRAGRPLLPLRIRGLLTEAIATEVPEEATPPDPGAAVEPGTSADPAQEQENPLLEMRKRIEKWLGPMLADMILPGPRDVTTVQGALHDRYALDFACLPDTTAALNWFRTLSEPSGEIRFERFHFGPHLARLLADGDTRPMRDRIDTDTDWRELAREVLPRRLEELLQNSAGVPVDLVISPHRTLSLLPWAALAVGDSGDRLLRSAVLSQTPVLTCLTERRPPVAGLPALIRLVDGPDGVWTGAEAKAWGLAPEDLERVLAVPAADPPATLARALTTGRGPWRFLHVAAHGDGTGLEQCLRLPDETRLDGRLSAAHALALHWPPSALMASCKIGLIDNVEHDEPIGFVMAVLAGGGRCVVAATDNIGDLAAGRVAGALVRLVREDAGHSLDRALRQAQLDLSDEDVPDWALFNAYVR